MLKKNRKFIAAIVLLFAILVAVQHYVPKPINWKPGFSSHSKSPYGCRILGESLDSLFPGSKVTFSNSNFYLTLPGDSMLNVNLIIITDQFKPDELDLSALLDFVSRGNNAFISVSDFPSGLSDTLHFGILTPLIDTGIFRSNAGNLRLFHVNKDSVTDFSFKRSFRTCYINRYDTFNTTRLGSDQQGNINFIMTRFGKGKFFLHCQPIAFTNYHLLYSNYTYAYAALSWLPIENTIWDQYYKPGHLVDLSPVRYILAQPALKSAYYLIFIILLLYMLFGSKRKQRIIPVLQPEANASLGFLITVGRLYYRTRKHADLVKKKIVYFNEFIRTKYYLSTLSDCEGDIRMLSLKSGIETDTIGMLLRRIEVLGKSENINQQELVEFHRLLENFYKNCN
jgi:hypothetical protein